MNDLQKLGMSAFFADQIEPDLEGIPGRIAHVHGQRLHVLAAAGRIQAYGDAILDQGDDLAVGDWILMQGAPEQGLLRAIKRLQRKSALYRKAVGGPSMGQVIAANMDTVWIITSATAELSAARLERYLAATESSGAQPVVIVNKIDLCAEPESTLAHLRQRLAWVPIFGLNALTGEGLEALQGDLKAEKTVALVGSSGVGKTTIRNLIVDGPQQLTQEIRTSDAKGRHTTTSRELVLSHFGGIVIDTPGMRELGLWDSDEGLRVHFQEIEQWASDCRFRDCEHKSEPGCAVRAAMERGELAPERLANLHKLRREQTVRSADGLEKRNAKRRWKQASKAMRKHSRQKWSRFDGG